MVKMMALWVTAQRACVQVIALEGGFQREPFPMLATGTTINDWTKCVFIVDLRIDSEDRTGQFTCQLCGILPMYLFLRILSLSSWKRLVVQCGSECVMKAASHSLDGDGCLALLRNRKKKKKNGSTWAGLPSA